MIRTELNANHARANVKVMTKRLKELGVDVKHGQVLEALAAAYGHKSWHTMNEAIKAQTPSIKVAQEHMLLCQAAGTSDYNCYEIEWMAISVDQNLVDLLIKGQAKLNDNTKHSEYRVEDEPSNYGNFEEDAFLPVEESTLVITKEYFWYEMRLKHQRGHFEHEPISIKEFLELAQKTGDHAVEVAEEEFGLSECSYTVNPDYDNGALNFVQGKLFLVNKDGDEDFQHALVENELILPKD